MQYLGILKKCIKPADPGLLFSKGFEVVALQISELLLSNERVDMHALDPISQRAADVKCRL